MLLRNITIFYQMNDTLFDFKHQVTRKSLVFVYILFFDTCLSLIDSLTKTIYYWVKSSVNLINFSKENQAQQFLLQCTRTLTRLWFSTITLMYKSNFLTSLSYKVYLFSYEIQIQCSDFALSSNMKPWSRDKSRLLSQALLSFSLVI